MEALTLDFASGKISVENVKKLVTYLGAAKKEVDGIMEDHKVSLRDLKHLPGIVRAIKGLVGVDYKQLLPELSDLDDAEKEELKAVFAEAFKLPNPELNEALKDGFAFLIEAVDAVLALLKMNEIIK